MDSYTHISVLNFILALHFSPIVLFGIWPRNVSFLVPIVLSLILSRAHDSFLVLLYPVECNEGGAVATMFSDVGNHMEKYNGGLNVASVCIYVR